MTGTHLDIAPLAGFVFQHSNIVATHGVVLCILSCSLVRSSCEHFMKRKPGQDLVNAFSFRRRTTKILKKISDCVPSMLAKTDKVPACLLDRRSTRLNSSH